MKIAKRLKSCEVKIVGPHTPLLFESSYSPPDGFDIVTVGKGLTRKEAADDAISQLKGHGLTPILLDVIGRVYSKLPHRNVVEGENGTLMYCILGVNVER